MKNRVNVSAVTSLLKHYYKLQGEKEVITAENINHGRCFNWAYLAYRMYPEVTLCSIKSWWHAFIRVDGKYYDSMTRQGVEDWKQLKTLRGRSVSNDLEILPEKEFKSLWRTHGGRPFVDIFEELGLERENKMPEKQSIFTNIFTAIKRVKF